MHITKWKKSVWNGYILYDSNYMTFWKRQNCGNIKKDQWSPGAWGRERWIREAHLQDFRIFRAVKLQAYLILLHFTLLCLVDTEVCFVFLQIEGLWQPCLQLVCWRYFSNSICSLHVSVSHCGNSQNISNFFIILTLFIVICDQWSLMLLLLLFWDTVNHRLTRWWT